MTFIIDPEFKARNRPQTGQERKNLELKIEQEGGARADSVWVGIIGGQRYLIDGHNTVEVCRQKGFPIPQERVVHFDSREEALEWMDLTQRSRRNLSLEEMLENKRERQERVKKARAEGQSTRAIAEQEGVSQKTIVSDLNDSGDTPVSPDAKVTGADGKVYKPRRKKTGGKRGSGKPKSKAKTPALADGEVAPETQCCPACKGSGRIPKAMFGELFGAILKVTGCDPKVNGGHVGKVTKALLSADPPYTGSEIMKLPAILKRVWPKVPCTIGVLEKYASWTRNGPPTNESELERLRREVGA